MVVRYMPKPLKIPPTASLKPVPLKLPLQLTCGHDESGHRTGLSTTQRRSARESGKGADTWDKLKHLPTVIDSGSSDVGRTSERGAVWAGGLDSRLKEKSLTLIF